MHPNETDWPMVAALAFAAGAWLALGVRIAAERLGGGR